MRALFNLSNSTVDAFDTGLRRLGRRRQQSIGYVGWVGHRNLGDEAMFEAARRLFAPASMEVFSGARRERLLSGVGLSGHGTFRSIVLGGGTLINAGYLGVVERALSLGLRVGTLGTGAGSSGFSGAREAVPEAWRPVLARIAHLGVRGYRTQAKLNELGIENARVVGDLALALTPDEAVKLADEQRYILNVAVPGRRAPDFPAMQMVQAIARSCRRLHQAGWKPLPVAFSPEDVAPIQSTLAQAGLQPVEVEQPASAEAFFALATNARFAMGVRLHCSVLSACAGLAPLTIAYCEKGYDFAETMDAAAWTVDAFELQDAELAERVLALAENAESLGPRIHARALHWKKRLNAYVREL